MKNKKRVAQQVVLVFLFLLSFGGVSTWANQNNPTDIMAQVEKQRIGENEIAEITMKLISKSGKTTTRKVVRKRILTDKNFEKSVIGFTYPSDVKGTKLLSIENTDNTSRWLYMPVLKRVRRVPSGNIGDFFLSTDFTYEDLSREQLRYFDYTYIKKEVLAGISCSVLQAVLKKSVDSEKSAYGKRILWIDEQMVIRKIEYYNSKGTLVKSMVASKVKTFDGKVRAQLIEMSNLETGHKTTLEYDSFNLKAQNKESHFSKNKLKR